MLKHHKLNYIYCFNVTVALVHDVDSRSIYKDQPKDEQSGKSQVPPVYKGVYTCNYFQLKY